MTQNRVWKALTIWKKTLAEGYSIFLYPEGTRNVSGKPLTNFHKGAFRIAIETETPVAVQTLVNIENIAGKDQLSLSPGNIQIVWSKPIETKGMTMKDLPQLVKKVKEQMLAALGEG